MKVKSESEVAQSYLTLIDPMKCCFTFVFSAVNYQVVSNVLGLDLSNQKDQKRQQWEG